jgi:acetyl/propionyl-CoA carboxylase alpha subunit
VAVIRSVLVANRGEIAVRVIRACRELRIGAAAVYEPADAGALHTALADGAVAVGSYLDGDALVTAAAEAGADAVHPGYGYLAESAGFAERVQRAGLVWVGPPPAAMRATADKVEARRLAEAAGLAVVPGYAGLDLSDAALRREATRVGFPLLVKAAAGGGGRGMRVVADAGELDAALAAARREAEAAFGSDRVFLERLVAAARHVEVQVLADESGRVVHLGERDCSLQRRHQKIVEESPSPAVDPALRAQLGDAAVAFARAVGYVGAGTVEFLLPADGRPVFLELNARLQVEHPVTEAVTGIDLVRAQLRIAAGESLELDEDELAPRGHAIEARLYAEDPARDFLPAAGRVERWEPPLWPGVRVDTALVPGDEVGVRYDPLLAKVIAYDEDRDACAERLAAALAETVLVGFPTNLGFLRWAVAHPDFRAGEATTDFVERRWHAGLVPPLPADVRGRALAETAPAGSVWHAFGDGQAPRDRELHVAGRHALWRGFAYTVGAEEAAAPERVAEGTLVAPMPGSVLRVCVTAGASVEAGEPLVLLEAMKMELTVSAPAAGTVTAVHARPGAVVRAGETLVELEA